MIKLLKDRIAVKPISSLAELRANISIEIPDTVQEEPYTMGIVKYTDEFNMEVYKGDRVHFSKHNGIFVDTVEEGRLLVIRTQDVVLVERDIEGKDTDGSISPELKESAERLLGN